MADGYGRWPWSISYAIAISHQPSAIDTYSDLFRLRRHQFQLRRLAAVQPLRDGEGGVHAHDAGVEVELRDAFEAPGRTFLDADAAAFAVVHENLVEAVRSIVADDARLRADQVTVVAGVAGA